MSQRPIMKLLHCAILLHLFKISCVFGVTTVEYYKELISENTAKARSYRVPQTNEEFKTGTESSDLQDFGSFDFIIVGAGSAGAVLATRLSEIHQWSILLLEAGDEETDFSLIPTMEYYLQFSEKNWGYYTTPQTNCCQGMKEKKCIIPRGKSIGGSSAINSMIVSRGNRWDYDKWAELGNPGWSYKDVLPYFIKSENSQINGDEGYHGKGGFWNIQYSSRPTPKRFVDLVEDNPELKSIDYNGKKQEGVSRTQFNIKHGQRQSTGVAFLDNARARSNLKILTKTLATKIIITEKEAQGIIFVTNGTKFVAKARKEVILSGGVFNSPQLLMLSGIGPRKHLEDLGIEPIEDLPVGENFSEHPQFLGLAFRTNYTSENEDLEKQIEDYLRGEGSLTSTSSGLGFIHTGDVPEGVAMIEYTFGAPRPDVSFIVNRTYNLNQEMTKVFEDNLNPKTDFQVMVSLLHEKSRGRVTLQSKDPLDFPLIDVNLFSEEEDFDNMINGIEFVLRLIQSEVFRKLNTTLIDLAPVCEDFQKYSKAYWRCAIRHLTMTTYHPCGTTAMGPSRENSVVDHNLKVHGFEKLRVVDAGVFPWTISGNTNAPVIMVAEKIADVIKDSYLK